MADWSELPLDIVCKFAAKVPPCLEDFAVFNSVSKIWRCAAFIEKSRLKPFAPYLLIAKREYDARGENEEGIRSFYSLYSKKLFNLRLPTQGRRCWGTPYGWLVTLGLNLKINLLNPFTNIQIALPPQPTFHDNELTTNVPPEEICKYFSGKFVFACNPSHWNTLPCASHLVMALYGASGRLAFSTPEDKVWTTLEQRTANKDVIFFNGYFYAVSCDGALRICEIDSVPPKVRDIASLPDGVSFCNSFYLVEISKNLHLIERMIKCEGESYSDCHINTLAFRIWMFDFNKTKWVKVNDFHEYALFVGNNSSFAISTSEYPEIKGNCIYFTDDHSVCYDTEFCDMGVHDYEKGTIKKFYAGDDKVSIFSRPAFFIPSL